MWAALPYILKAVGSMASQQGGGTPSSTPAYTYGIPNVQSTAAAPDFSAIQERLRRSRAASSQMPTDPFGFTPPNFS